MIAAVETGLPALAWLVDCARGDFKLRCGSCVEISDHGVFEGCWTGDFRPFDFDRADYVFGSGMRLRDGAPVFVPPSHTLDALFVFIRPDGYCVANSLAFLCEHCAIDLPFAAYGQRFASVVLGIDAYEKRLHVSASGTLYRIVYDRFTVEAGHVVTKRLASEQPFSDYASYRAHMLGTLRQAAENAADPARKRTFAPMATCSTGYDSAAGSALAAEIGCREALTFRTARGGDDDSGRAVGENLGLSVIELPGHAGGWTPTVRSEAEFCATGIGGEDVVFSQADSVLRDRLLITGFHGDAVWDLAKAAVTSIERGDISGSSLGEFRLRLPFVHLPLPFVGCRHWPAIRRISQSEEMLPYRVGGKYDRPIPRRIVEERGVPREMFGQQKNAVSTLIFGNRSRLSSESLAEVEAQENKIVGNRRHILLLRGAQFFVLRATNRLLRDLLLKLFRRPALQKRVERVLIGDYRVFEHGHPRNSDAVFLWALTKQRHVYAGGVSASPDRQGGRSCPSPDRGDGRGGINEGSGGGSGIRTRETR